MSPYEHARELCEQEAPGSFGKYLEFHLTKGHVVSTPKTFMMLLATNRAFLLAGMNPYLPFTGRADTWYISFFAGDMAEGWRFEPSALRYYAFHRDHSLRKRLSIWPSYRLKNRTA